jgi:5-methylcytosine-specific restriction enzyme subunit McrC
VSEIAPLTTYDDSEPLELDSDDASFIAQHLAGRVTIRRELADERFRINPGPYVGVVRLPSGTILRSVPRIKTANIFRMLAVVYGLPSLRLTPRVELGDLREMLEFVAEYYADRLEERIEQGLYRAYVEVEDNLPVVRGRIQIVDHIRHNHVLRHNIYCRFSELTWDVLDNQVLRRVAHDLSGWPFSTNLQTRLQQLDRRMDEVSLIRVESSDLDRLTYTRLNAGYEPLHRLCRLLLDGMSLSEEEGRVAFDSFLLDMNVLFERFVGRMFELELPRRLGRTALQRRAALGHRLRGDGTRRAWGVIRPDIEITRRGGVVIVLDTKYKKTRSDAIKNPDFYQVLSYCESENTSLGGLIYPKSEFDQDDEIEIRNSPIRIRRFALDLSVPEEDLLNVTKALVARVAAWVDASEELADIAS